MLTHRNVVSNCSAVIKTTQVRVCMTASSVVHKSVHQQDVRTPDVSFWPLSPCSPVLMMSLSRLMRSWLQHQLLLSPALRSAHSRGRHAVLSASGPHVWEGGGGTVRGAWPAYVHVFFSFCVSPAGALHAERPWYSHIVSPPSSHVWEGYTGMCRTNSQVNLKKTKNHQHWRCSNCLMLCFQDCFCTNALIFSSTGVFVVFWKRFD